MNAPLPAPTSAPYLKLVAVGLLAVPALLLAMLAIGELASGDGTGIQHVPPALALIVLAVAGWRFPKPVGILLLIVSALLLIGWIALASTSDSHDSAAVLVLVASMVFLPPLVAGWLLYAAGSVSRPDRSEANAHTRDLQ